MFEFFKGFGVTFSTMFKKVVTEEYPENFRPPRRFYSATSSASRRPGEVCGVQLCAWACPADAIYVEGGAAPRRRATRPASGTAGLPINYLRCIGCRLTIGRTPRARSR
jgi:NADH-quinone oxidoreductase subunit I